LSELTEKEIPDAKERLNFVIKMTDDAAHATLNAIDDILPVSDDLSEKSKDLQEKWTRFTAREMPLDEFKTMAQEITHYLAASTEGAGQIHSKLNEVVMAQGFQDLTGQVIRKVIKLVQEVEGSLVELIRISKTNAKKPNKQDKAEQDERAKLEGPAVPGIQVEGAVNSQDEVDDLLSSLGF
jgi:chemotaxis protein CheZ